ncbi:MAG: hypothetical protein NPINA01_23550 [Nitrospinaceae bacterium]|nr:MAG: hypothetical protein NPINA01_23550 [Nitrospinaceae bacterium]
MPEFRVEKTSARGSSEKPCAEAVLKETQAMTDDGSLQSRKVWVISINLMDELITFRDKYGELILDQDPSFLEIPDSIEIYDDWREIEHKPAD